MRDIASNDQFQGVLGIQDILLTTDLMTVVGIFGAILFLIGGLGAIFVEPLSDLLNGRRLFRKNRGTGYFRIASEAQEQHFLN